MSETPDQQPTEPTADVAEGATAPTPTPQPPPAYFPPPQQRTSRLNQVAAWVGIVAGVVFIVAVVFGTGFMVGKNAGGPRFDRDRGAVVFHRGGPPMSMHPFGPGEESERGPSQMPGGPGLRPGGPAMLPGGPGMRSPEPEKPPTPPTTSAPARP